MNYYISDLHFGHGNIIKFDQRPFTTTEEMTHVLIRNWNSTVTNEDIVYILGDFCWLKEDKWVEILDELKGNKVLIRGNHDLKNMSANLKNKFADIKDYKEIDDNGRIVIMCHYPILAYKHSFDPNTFMLFGHVHNNTKESHLITQFIKKIRQIHTENFDNRGQLVNVGCMMPWMDYTPRTLDYLIDKLDNGEIYDIIKQKG